MMTLAALAYLRSPDGQAALAAGAGLDLDGGSLLRELTRLRQRLGPERAAAVVEQVMLRRRAAGKFSLASEMLFTSDGLEQASGELLAAHSAARYCGFSRVADCCCGIGGDTLALARESRVDAYDVDPLRLACAAHNAGVHGLADRIAFHLADVAQLDPTLQPSDRDEFSGGALFGGALVGGERSGAMKDERIEAIFFDPSRRSGGRRIFSLLDYHPPVSLVERWLPAIPAIGVKVAPGVAHDEVTWECEQEFVAIGPDLKEGLLWFGPLAGASRRATVLPAGDTLVAGTPPEPPTGEPLAWLYDPSPAVTRAGLIWELAALLGAQQLDARLAYLTAPQRTATPFAHSYPIEEWMPFNLKRLKARLRALGVGRVEVRRRGAPIEPAELERSLRQEGGGERLLFLTRQQGRLIAIICLPRTD